MDPTGSLHAVGPVKLHRLVIKTIIWHTAIPSEQLWPTKVDTITLVLLTRRSVYKRLVGSSTVFSGSNCKNTMSDLNVLSAVLSLLSS